MLLVKGNSTRLAELGTRSVGSQASLEVETRSVVFQSSVFTGDLGTLWDIGGSRQWSRQSAASTENVWSSPPSRLCALLLSLRVGRWPGPGRVQLVLHSRGVPVGITGPAAQNQLHH